MVSHGAADEATAEKTHLRRQIFAFVHSEAELTPSPVVVRRQDVVGNRVLLPKLGLRLCHVIVHHRDRGEPQVNSTPAG